MKENQISLIEEPIFMSINPHFFEAVNGNTKLVKKIAGWHSAKSVNTYKESMVVECKYDEAAPSRYCMMFGVGPAESDKCTAETTHIGDATSDQTVGYFCCNGYWYCAGQNSGKAIGPVAGQGSILSIWVNLEKGEVTFYIDKKRVETKKEIAFKEFRVIVSIYDAGDAVSLGVFNLEK